MKKPNGKIEWTLAEDGEAWQARQGGLQQEELRRSEPAIKTIHMKEVVLAAVLGTLLLVLVSGSLWQRHGAAGQTSIQQRAVIEEEQALTHTLELLDGQVQVNKIQRLDTLVMAQVIVNYPEEGATRAYRELRFYEKKGDQWRRIYPSPTLLGPEKTLTIAHFAIHFSAVDADTVYKTVPKLERLYAKLTGDFGLPAINDSSVYSVELVTTGVYPLFNRIGTNRSIVIPSPALLSSPVEMGKGELLYQSLIYPLANLRVSEVVDRHSAEWQDRFSRRHLVPQALALWELWAEGGALANGRVEVVQWRFANTHRGAKEQLLPDHYEHLCHTFHIWGMMPWNVSIPLTCTEADKHLQSDLRFSTLPDSVRTQLYPKQEGGVLAGTLGDSAQFETLIEYIVASYGRQKLPLFITALGEEDSLDSLAQTLFGVTPAEFRAGWQAYVEQRYQVK